MELKLNILKLNIHSSGVRVLALRNTEPTISCDQYGQQFKKWTVNDKLHVSFQAERFLLRKIDYLINQAVFMLLQQMNELVLLALNDDSTTVCCIMSGSASQFHSHACLHSFARRRCNRDLHHYLGNERYRSIW
jgi:hypothetical protein